MKTMITRENLQQVMYDLKQDLGIELFSKEADMLDELYGYAWEGLSPRTNDDEDEIERLQDIIEEISRLASY